MPPAWSALLVVGLAAGWSPMSTSLHHSHRRTGAAARAQARSALAPLRVARPDQVLGSTLDLSMDGLVDEDLIPASLGSPYPHADPCRGVFCSRTLDMRGIDVIGYDMDYTLVRYRMVEWEQRAYHHAKEVLRRKGFFVDGLDFLDDLVVRGLIVDKELGNLVKVDRFGYVREGMHGTKMIPRQQIKELYNREVVDLRDTQRWEFINTLFSVSEGCLYMQLVERLDDNSLRENSCEPFDWSKCDSYSKLWSATSKATFRAHVEGALKLEIKQDPAKFVELDSETILTLLAQRIAGKKLLLITNSDWEYTDTMMSYLVEGYNQDKLCKDPALGTISNWRSLFDCVIVMASKPSFFTARNPLHRIVTVPHVPGLSIAPPPTGDQAVRDSEFVPCECPPGEMLMKDALHLEEGYVYTRGSATMVEKLFRCSSDAILYIGDHVFADVNMAKATLRWRTMLVVQELESEVLGLALEKEKRDLLIRLVSRRADCFDMLNHLQMQLAILTGNLKALDSGLHTTSGERQRERLEGEAARIQSSLGRLRAVLEVLDSEVDIKREGYGDMVNKHWGFMSLAGLVDKSHLMRQIEKYTDIYTSRVSNLHRYTPYCYFSSAAQSLAHDRRTDLHRGKSHLETVSTHSPRRTASEAKEEPVP